MWTVEGDVVVCEYCQVEAGEPGLNDAEHATHCPTPVEADSGSRLGIIDTWIFHCWYNDWEVARLWAES